MDTRGNTRNAVNVGNVREERRTWRERNVERSERNAVKSYVNDLTITG